MPAGSIWPVIMLVRTFVLFTIYRSLLCTNVVIHASKTTNMRLEKKPQSQFQCVGASYGLRNSLDISFTDLNQLPSNADLLNSRKSSLAELSCITSPKELQLRFFIDNEEPKSFGSCVKTQPQDTKAFCDKPVSYVVADCSAEIERGRRMSTKEKDQRNLCLKKDVQAKSDVFLYIECSRDRQIKHSSTQIAKKGTEKMNLYMNKVKKIELEKNEMDKSNMEKRNMEKKEMEKGKTEKKEMEKKREEIMPLDKDVEETFPKWRVIDENRQEDKEEKGSLEIKNAQKDLLLVMIEEKRKRCRNVDGNEKFEEKDVEERVDETTEIIEKWKDEKGEKVERMITYTEKNKVSQIEESEKEKINSPQMQEFEGNVETNWGMEIELEKRNEGRVEDVSVTSIVNCSFTPENRSSVSNADMYEPNKKFLEPEEGNCYERSAEWEEMYISELIKQRGSPVESTDEGNSMLCLSGSGCFEAVSKFQKRHCALRTDLPWINVSSHTYKEELSKIPGQGLFAVGHGDDRNRSGSPRECSGFPRSGDEKCRIYSRQGSSRGLGGPGGSGGGGGRDGGDDNWGNKRHLDFTGGRRTRKQDKKLKKKCRLEHGILAKEQIFFVIGWLLERNHSVPEALNELLKCLSICLRGRDPSIDACKICNALLLMLKHSSACATEKCKCCDGIALLYALECDQSLLDSITEQALPPGSPSREQLKKDLKNHFAESSSSEDETTSESESLDVRDSPSVPEFVKSGCQSRENESNNEQGVVQGPPIETDRYNSEFWPFNPKSFNPHYELRNYSLPVDAHNARSGSVIYGSKELIKAMVCGWQESAEHQRTSDNQRLRLHHSFVSNRAGVILQNQADKLRIKNNNYELEEEWTLLTERALGAGVSGSCYAGCDCETEFTFCVKRIPLHKFYSDEILIWLEMEHPDIVELYGVIVYDGYVYVIQELIRGPTLKEHISLRKALNSFEALMYLQHLLELLVYLKCKNVIHNDIKADNILVREPSTSTRLVLIDFGLASHTSYVQPGIHPVGGQTHWSPEKAASEGYSFPADLWAAMAVFIHMLGGVEPWVVRFKHTPLLHCIIKQQSPPLQDVPEGVPRQIHRLIVDGWTVDPLARPSASDLLKHEAFKLLDVDPSMDLFMSHLSYVESLEVEIPNAEYILEESETEELISQAQMHLSLKQQCCQPSPALVSPGLADVRLNSSSRPFLSSEGSHIEPAWDRPGGGFPSSDRRVSLNVLRPIHVMPPLEENIFEHIVESASWDQQEMMKDPTMKYSQPVDDDVSDDLSAIYDDLSFFGGVIQPVFYTKNPPVLDDIQNITEQLNTSQTAPKQPEQVSQIHRVKLHRASSLTGAMASAAQANGPTPSIPTVVADIVLSDEESKSLQLQSNDGQDDVDRMNPAIGPPSSQDGFHTNSMGTTLRMMLDGDQIYCIHLHPGTECMWSEVVRRASTEIHRRGVMAFTAEVQMGDQREPVDVSATIPSVPEILVDTVPLTAFQDQGWNWKVEDSRIIYHPNYHGHFGPEFDD